LLHAEQLDQLLEHVAQLEHVHLQGRRGRSITTEPTYGDREEEAVAMCPCYGTSAADATNH